jgi:hypothetical protein
MKTPLKSHSYARRVAILTTCAVIAGHCQDTKAQSDFNDTTEWTPLLQATEPVLQTFNDGFSISIPANTVGPGPYNAWNVGYQTAYDLTGDFNVEANFLLNQWPPGNGVRIGINVNLAASVERTSQTFLGSAFGDETYVFDSGTGLADLATTDQMGTLRLSRTGSTLSGYYLAANGQWVLIGSGTYSTGDLVIGLLAWSDSQFFGDQAVDVSFSDPVISGVEVQPVTGSAPEPSSFAAIASGLCAFTLCLTAVRKRFLLPR